MKFAPFIISLLILTHAVNARASSRVALVIGANSAITGRNALRFAYNDAEDIAATLRLAGFASSDIVVLRDPKPEKILATLDALMTKSVGDSSMFFFYYSGHADGQSLFPGGESLSLATLRNRFVASKATLTLGIIDACRGGGWTGTKGLSATEEFDVSVPMFLGNEGSVLISSSSGLADAHESETLQGSFFTHYWNAALRGAGDSNGDHVVTLVEAFNYSKTLTIRDTAQLGKVPQQPSFFMNLHGKTDLPLVALSAEHSALTVEQNTGPLELVHLETGLVVLELPQGKRTMKLSVPPGRYLLRRTREEPARAREIEVLAGKMTYIKEDNLAVVGNQRLAVKGSSHRPPRALSTGFGVGLGRFATTSMEDSSFGASLAARFNYRLTDHWHAVFSLDSLMFGAYSPDSKVLRHQHVYSLGVRWIPLAKPNPTRSTQVLSHAYLRLGVGAADLALIKSDWPYRGISDTWGVGITAGVGINIISGRFFGLSAELADSAGWYDDQTQHQTSFTLFFTTQP